MTHAPARRCGSACDEPDTWLFPTTLRLVAQKLGRILLARATDLPDHDDRLGLLVREEHFQHVNELRPLHGITADTHASGLAEPFGSCLKDCLICKRARARDNPDLARPM